MRWAGPSSAFSITTGYGEKGQRRQRALDTQLMLGSRAQSGGNGSKQQRTHSLHWEQSEKAS